MEYSYLPNINNLTTATMKDFTVEHYLTILLHSNSKAQILFLFKQIMALLGIDLETQRKELIILNLNHTKPC